jgi:hypothetical protein
MPICRSAKSGSKKKKRKNFGGNCDCIQGELGFVCGEIILKWILMTVFEDPIRIIAGFCECAI